MAEGSASGCPHLEDTIKPRHNRSHGVVATKEDVPSTQRAPAAITRGGSLRSASVSLIGRG